MRFDAEYDVVVAGGGAGGMTAALVCAIEGLKVLLIEKSHQLGGTASTSAGTLWIPGNSCGASEADREEARQYLGALIGASARDRLRAVYLEQGPNAIDYLMARSAVHFASAGIHPDYQSDLPGAAVAGRAIVPVPFDGRLLGEDFKKLRPPIPEFMIFGGMMVGKADIPHLIARFSSVKSFVYSASLFLRYLKDRLRRRRGTRLVMGNALVARLFYSLRSAGASVRTNCGLEKLDIEDGKVIGVVTTTGRKIRARHGVIVATGGFAHDPVLRARHMPGTTIHSLAAPANTGDGIRAIDLAGGHVLGGNGRNAAFYTPVSRAIRSDGTVGLYPHLSLDRAKPGIIAVDRTGCRFVNEAQSYHDFVVAMFKRGKTARSIFLVCTEAFVHKYGLGVIYPGTRQLDVFERNGYIQRAPTIAALAQAIGVDTENLAQEVANINVAAATGRDEAFGRGASVFNRFNGDSMHKPNPCLGPIINGPFVALEIWPAEIACSAGIETDENAQVIDDNGQSIAGLYACGNDMASIMEGTYPGPGTTLGPAITFGYVAARHLAASREKSGSRDKPEGRVVVR